MLHLVSSSFAAKALRQAGVDGEVVDFDDALSMGPLADVDEGSAGRRAWWAEIFAPRSFDRDLDDRALWDRIRRDARAVLVWHGPNPAERLFALRACWQLRDTSGRLHEARIDAPRDASLADHFWSVGLLTSEHLLAGSRRSRAPISDIAARAQLWEEIRTRGGLLRELAGDHIVELPVSEYERALATTDWASSLKTVAQILVERPVGDTFLTWRVHELLHAGVVEGRGAANRLGLPEEIRRAPAPER